MKTLIKFVLLVTAVSVINICQAAETEKAKSTEGVEQAKKERWAKNQTPSLDLEPEAPDNIIQSGAFSKASPTIVSADDKKYTVTLYSNQTPIPMQAIHSWTVHIEKEGKPVENAKIYIHGGMPAHRHGFPTKPRVNKYLGKGDYLIEGVKFSMIGEWEMRINIKEPGKRDRAVFRIKLPQ